ncbi:MAG: phosphate acyltransferase PlsX [Deltaproteobacteria bacterium]|nr:phosphate acyltransferase PlsX [Deltaproteobacteria bacterium]
MIRAALDAMGADGGIAPLVEGAAQLSLEDVPIHTMLVGDQAAIAECLRRTRHDPTRVSIIPADGFVAMNEKPATGLDARPDCSVLTAARLVATGEAAVLVSAGNTGAVILGASRTFERLEGVKRVALCAVHPTVEPHGPKGDPFGLMLDVGATLQCSAEELTAFARMGSCYSRLVSDIEAPRVALLSNGSEPTKGTEAVIAAHRALAEADDLRFIGNVEGLDIPRGTADVVVCEGFVGNIVLKMLEGVSDAALGLAKHAGAARLRYRLGLALLSSGLRRIRELTDWKQYGGAPILGFDRAVIKAHGRSNARAIRNALRLAGKTVQRELVPQLRISLAAKTAHPRTAPSSPH